MTIAGQAGGSGRFVQDFSPYCEGDIEPRLNKKIRVLIDSSADHIVYLDEDLYVEWAFSRLAADGTGRIRQRGK